LKEKKKKHHLPEDIHSIIVRSTNWVGDSVITTPVFQFLREIYPHARLDVLARPWNGPVFENNPCIDNVIVCNEKAGLFSFARSVRYLRKNSYDLAVLLPNSFSSALQVYMGKIRYRVGYNTDKRSALLTHPVSPPPDKFSRHQVFYYLYLLESVTGYNPSSPQLQLYLTDSEKKEAREFLEKKGIKENDFCLGLNPGAEYGPAKRYPPDRFASAADLLMAEYKAKTVIFGSSKEKEIAQEVEDNMHFKAVNLAGKTSLRQVMALIQQMDVFITNDTGSMHVAAALDVPVVAVFGSTNSLSTGPFSSKSQVVRTAVPPDCAPCLKRECPRDFSCMLSLPPQALYKKTVEFLCSLSDVS